MSFPTVYYIAKVIPFLATRPGMQCACVSVSVPVVYRSLGYVHKSRGDNVVRMWAKLEEIMCIVCVDVTEGA